MNVQAIAQHFRTRGYAHVRRVLPPPEVRRLREIVEDHFIAHPEQEMCASRFLDSPDLAAIPFRPDVVQLLNAIVGPRHTVYPNFTVRRDKYTSWHVDGAFTYARSYLRDPEFRAVQCGIYLQPNDRHEGGGLDVVPDSHRSPVALARRGPWRGVRNALRILPRRPRSIPSDAGDLILWDGRLLHRGTRSRRPASQVKLAIYWSVSPRHPEHTAAFLAHLVGRGSVRTAQGVETVQRYAEIRDLRFPDSYPAHVVRAVREAGLHVASY